MTDSSPDALAAALESARYDALAAGDYAAFGAHLDEELSYIHSSSSVDTKASYLAQLESGFYRYGPVEHPIDRVLDAGGLLFVYGGMVCDVLVDGTQKHLDNVTTAIWRRSGEAWRLVHFQSTPRPKA
ncbi:MAG TPA: nuclear transport factor 2 family protein [Gryllotalpicola sp.]